jgi:hypothetical protein
MYFRQLTRVILKKNNAELDFAETDKLPGPIGKKGLTIRILSLKPLRFKANNLKVISKSVIRRDNFIYTLKLEREPGNKKALIRFNPDLTDR